MTQVSRKILRKEVEERIYEVFLDSISMVNSKNQVQRLIDDLLTSTEKIMLAKRLAIALLLSKGYDQRTISSILKVGLETISKVNRSLREGKGGYTMVVDNIIRREKLREFLNKIDDLITDIVPPKGRNWSTARRQRWEEKMNQQKPF